MRVLKSSFLTQGPEIGRFEQEFAKFCGARYAVACSSATAGLHLSAMVLGVGPGDLWWTSPNTFCATADAALRCGADVNFIDIEWGTYNMDLHLLEDRLKQAARKNRLPKVVVPVHFAGNPLDLEYLDKLRQRFGFKVVEDAAHATGAELKGEKVGSCKWSDLCVFSFHAVKIITTGEGGMITTNSINLYEKLCRLRTHGISRNPRHLQERKKAPWYYEKLELGNHYRMTDIQAALGRSQLKKILLLRSKRSKLADLYIKKMPDYFCPPRVTPNSKPSWHLFVTTIPATRNRRDILIKKLRKNKIFAAIHYPIVPSLKFYRLHDLQRKTPHDLPICKRFFEKTISLPLFPELKTSEANYIIKKLESCI